MRHLRRRLGNPSGSLIVTAAVASAVIAIMVTGMLTYISNEYAFNVRSHRWMEALNIAEAGVELGIAEVNNFYFQGAGFQSSRGWYNAGGGMYYRSTAYLTNTSGQVAGSFYTWLYNVGTTNPYVAAWGWCNVTPRGPVVYRAVECYLAPNARFPAAMVAKQKIDMNGNNATVDSYDSTDPTKSTGSLYDPTKRRANGDIASNDTITNTLDVTLGNANIYGRVLLSPSGSVTMGPNGSIGPTTVTADRATTVSAAQNQGWVRNDFQVDIPDVTLPAGAASWTSLGSVNNTTTINPGDYRLSGIELGGSESLSIATGGRTRLYVDGDISLSGNALMRIANGGRVEIYCSGSVSVAGNGIVNDALSPLNCQFYGLPSSTSWTLNGNGQWIGTVYAPNAALSLRGGGTNGDMSGAIIAKTITLNGVTTMHYDESLAWNGPMSSYNVASWKSYRWTGSGGTVSD
jgi:hypothetical protein